MCLFSDIQVCFFLHNAFPGRPGVIYFLLYCFFLPISPSSFSFSPFLYHFHGCQEIRKKYLLCLPSHPPSVSYPSLLSCLTLSPSSYPTLFLLYRPAAPLPVPLPTFLLKLPSFLFHFPSLPPFFLFESPPTALWARTTKNSD